MEELIKIIQERGIEAIGRFYSTYRAIVIGQDSNNQNRLKVYIPNLFNGITAWAYPKGQMGGDGFGFKGLTPKETSIVYVEFEGGDPRHPLWTYHGWAIDECPPDLQGTDTLGIVTPKGNKIILQEKDGILTVKINGDINITSLEGNVNVECPKDVNIISENIILKEGEVGIPESTPLVERINTLEKDINDLKKVFNSWSVIPRDGGMALKSLVNSWSQKALEITQVDDIASKNIKQPH